MTRILYRLGYQHRGAPLADDLRLDRGRRRRLRARRRLRGHLPRRLRHPRSARPRPAIDQLRAHVPDGGGATAQVVVHDPSGAPLAGPPTSTRLAQRLDSIDHVSYVTEPRLSGDGDTALLIVSYDVPVTDPDLVGANGYDPLVDAIEPLRDAGLQAELGGELPGGAESEMKGTGELAGVIAALVLLIIAFGSVVAAGLPLAVALTGLAVGSAGVTLLAGIMDVSTAAPTVATMVGLGVGIDYALLLVTRHVEFLGQGLDKREAAGRAMATAGRSVVFASATVLISLMGLRFGGLPVYSTFGYATAIAVVSVLAAALTLVPALCGLAGHRLMPRKVRKGRARQHQVAAHRSLGGRGRPSGRSPRRSPRSPSCSCSPPPPWACAPGRRTAAATAPTPRMRRAYDLIAAEYGDGANGPFTLVVDTDAGRRRRPSPTRSPAEPGVVGVTTPVTTPDGAISVFDAQPAYGPADERTSDLVTALRDDLPAGVEVTGHHPALRRPLRDALGPALDRSSASWSRSRCCCWR